MDAARARRLAIGWLARREHSRAEVSAKLARKGCAADVAAEVVGKLTAEGSLSDERLAEAVVRTRVRRGYGPVRIRGELEQKGLAREMIAGFVDSPAKDWFAEVERVRRNKFGAGAPRSFEERARQARFLQRRGFTYEQIQRALSARTAD